MRVEQREQLIHVRRREQLQLRAKRRTVVQRADRRFSLLSRPEDPNRRHFALQIHLQHLAILRVPVDLADPRLLVHREFLRRERGGSARKEANQLAAQHAAAGEDFVGVVGAEQAEKLTAPLAVAYCNRCTAGLLLGGAKAVHLMELCMGTYQG